MIAHKVAFSENGHRPVLGQGGQPIVLPPAPGTSPGTPADVNGGNLTTTLLMLGVAVLATVFAVTVVMTDTRD